MKSNGKRLTIIMQLPKRWLVVCLCLFSTSCVNAGFNVTRYASHGVRVTSHGQQRLTLFKEEDCLNYCANDLDACKVAMFSKYYSYCYVFDSFALSDLEPMEYYTAYTIDYHYSPADAGLDNILTSDELAYIQDSSQLTDYDIFRLIMVGLGGSMGLIYLSTSYYITTSMR